MTTRSTLKQTPVEPTTLEASELKAGKLFAGLAREKQAWMLASLILAAVALVEPFVWLRYLKQEEKAIILDPSGTYYISPVIAFKQATEIQKNIGSLATQCLFSQNPSGYDLEYVIDDLFIGSAKEKVLKNWEEQQMIFKEKNLHQKPEIFSTTVLKAEGEFVLVKVEGQIIRMGSFEGTNFAHSQSLQVQFVLNKNPNLIKSGNYPFIVCDFKYKFL